MPTAWFHVPHLPEAGDVAALDKKEAKHAAGARRLEPGDEVVLFDGAGVSATATIRGRDDRGDLELEVGEHRTAAAEAPSIELAASLPKGDRVSIMLDMATQLGIATFTPLKCDFSVVSLDRKRQDPTERWTRIMLEACKQSRRATLPAIRAESTPAAVIERAATTGATIVVGDAEEGRLRTRSGTPPTSCFWSGPRAASVPRSRRISPGRRRTVRSGRDRAGILRVETAAAALIAAARSH